jgi:hypothetical protein
MRLPQQRHSMANSPGSVRLSRPGGPASTANDHKHESVRPAYGAPGVDDCLARCQLYPPGPVRDTCRDNCFF